MYGKNVWLIADGFMSNTKTDKNVSHEAVCVLNLSGEKANVKILYVQGGSDNIDPSKYGSSELLLPKSQSIGFDGVYFEDEEPLAGFSAVCENDRTNHIRLDKIVNDKGQKIPKEKPYALLIESDRPVVCQHTRLDVTAPDMALMTTIAY